MFVLLDYTFSYFLEQETFVSLWLIGVGRGGGIYERKWKITQKLLQIQWNSNSSSMEIHRKGRNISKTKISISSLMSKDCIDEVLRGAAAVRFSPG